MRSSYTPVRRRFLWIATGVAAWCTYLSIKQLGRPVRAGSPWLLHFALQSAPSVALGLNICFEIMILAVMVGIIRVLQGWMRLFAILYCLQVFLPQTVRLAPAFASPIRWAEVVVCILDLGIVVYLLQTVPPL